MKKSIAKLTGASAHTEYERPTNDYYATDPNALKAFLKAYESDGHKLNKKVWECACGLDKNLSNYLSENEYDVKATDITFGQDFLEDDSNWDGDILTNPPFKLAKQFVDHSLDKINDGNKVIMLLRIQFLEGQRRYDWFKSGCLKNVYIHSKRIKIWLNNDQSISGNALCFAWFVWEKGYQKSPTISWIGGE